MDSNISQKAQSLERASNLRCIPYQLCDLEQVSHFLPVSLTMKMEQEHRLHIREGVRMHSNAFSSTGPGTQQTSTKCQLCFPLKV